MLLNRLNEHLNCIKGDTTVTDELGLSTHLGSQNLNKVHTFILVSS